MEMLRLRKWQIRTRCIPQQIAILHRRWQNLIGSPTSFTSESDQESAAIVYRKALDSGLVRGRSIAQLPPLLVCRLQIRRNPPNLKEVSAASRIKKKMSPRCYRLLLRELGMTMPVEDPVRCVSRSLAELRFRCKLSRRRSVC